MSKKQLYFVICVLAVIILYLLFAPQEEVMAPEGDIDTEAVDSTPSETDVSDTDSASTESDEAPLGEIFIEGTLIGFADGKDQFLGAYKYALVDDGSEVLRVDIRTIVGYQVLNLENELGVEIGHRIVLRGYLEDGMFVATKVE